MFESGTSSFLLKIRDFPGSAVVKNPPANTGDMGSSPGPGRSHMPRSIWALVPQLLKPAHSRAFVPRLPSPNATTTEARVPGAHALQQEKPLRWEARAPQLEKARMQQRRPNAAKNKFKINK